MMQSSVILCDFAEQDPSGKIHMLGAGWSVIGPSPVPHAVVIFLQAINTPTGSPVPITLRLVDTDGQIVTMPGVAGQQRMEFAGQIEIRKLPGAPDEATGGGAFTVNVAPLPLQPGGKYTWKLEVDGKEEASADFFVRSSSDLQPRSFSGYEEYESRLAQELSKMGYAITKEPEVRSLRPDFSVQRNGVTVYIEVKLYSMPIGISVINQAIGMATILSASVLLVGSSELTTAGREILQSVDSVEFVMWRDESDDPELRETLERLLGSSKG